MKSPRPEPGFTLLELLVAVTITLLLAGIMLSVAAGTLNLWRRAQDDFTANSAAQLALDTIERDLHAAFHRQDGSTSIWLAVDVSNSPAALVGHGWQTASRMKPATAESQRLVPDPGDGPAPAIADARFGLSGAWLRFLGATTESSDEQAVPRAIAYQLARRPASGAIAATNPAAVRYTLFRTALTGPTTFTAGYDVAAGYGAALANPATGPDALASNVVDLGVWLYVRDADGTLRRIYPADNGDLSHRATAASAPGYANRFPDVADVMVRVLTDEGARLVEDIEQSPGSVIRPADGASDAEWWWAVVVAHSRVFVRRVEIKGGAL